jgi:transposase-like protein
MTTTPPITSLYCLIISSPVTWGKVKDNARNGYSHKHIQGAEGALALQVPRDRTGTFEPQIIAKRQTRFDGFDDKIIALYARGLSVEDIQQQLQELYGVEVSSSLISNVTASVSDDVKAWQSRPLEPLYPIVYLDCLVVKVREDKRIINKAVYLALGVNLEGQKELLGMWMSQNEGSKFWLSVLTELKNRGLEEILIVCVDGLTGFPEAIESVYSKAKVQLCIVHMVRNSLKYVSWKDRKALVEDLKLIYRSKTLEEAELALSAFSNKWDKKYPIISQSWLRNWDRLTPFFAYPADVRRAIYTTNAIESLNMTLRKVIKNKRVFPNDEAVFKLLYLAINNISKKWTMPIHNWKEAMNWFMIEFSDRMINYVK